MRGRLPLCCVLACAGCSLFTTFDGLDNDGPNDASADVAIGTDATVVDDATGPASDAGTDTVSKADADASAPAGLLTNGGFESSGSTCSPEWLADLGATETSTFARTGAKACKVCAPSGGGDGSMYATLPYQPGQWTLKAYFHAPEASPALTDTRVEIEFWKGGTYVDSQAAGNAIGAVWGATQVSATSPNNTPTDVHFEVGGTGPDGACVIIDDVFVERQ